MLRAVRYIHVMLLSGGDLSVRVPYTEAEQPVTQPDSEREQDSVSSNMPC